MKKKITFWNQITQKKRVIKFTFKWDYINHQWNVIQEGIFGTSENTYQGKPEQLIQHCIDCLQRKNEYVTVK